MFEPYQLIIINRSKLYFNLNWLLLITWSHLILLVLNIFSNVFFFLLLFRIQITWINYFPYIIWIWPLETSHLLFSASILIINSMRVQIGISIVVNKSYFLTIANGLLLKALQVKPLTDLFHYRPSREVH
jgi:hypothetical protein